MKSYDIAFSMGFSCGGTMALRRAGLQYASYPLDWVGTPGIQAGADMILSRFRDWLDKEDLELFAVRGGSFQMNIYRNRRTGFGFAHDFSRFRRLDEIFPEVAAKYARRCERFLDGLAKAKSALVVYVERPIDVRRPNDALLRARQTLTKACPACEFDLVYFHRVAGATACTAEDVASGVTAVGCEYAQLEFGEISHAIEPRAIADYLGKTAELAVRPSAADEARYADETRKRKRAKTGTGLDRLKYRLYRTLEKQLIAKGLVPRDFPLWFY